jgi:hypothetical protein
MKKFNIGHPEVLSFPFTSQSLANLGPSNLVSPMVGDAHGMPMPSNELLRMQVLEVQRAVNETRNNIWPGWLFAKYTGSERLAKSLRSILGLSENYPKGIAKWVEFDHPFDSWDKYVEPFAKANGIKMPTMGPGKPFIPSVYARAKAHRMIIDALSRNFQVKYQYGTPRPCELMDHSIEATDTPAHPSYPSGHATFAGATARAFELIYVANEEQKAEVRLAMMQLHFGRVLLGIHYPVDNVDGFKLGYESF